MATRLDIEKAIAELESAKNVRFGRLVTLCTDFFGSPRIQGSHHIFRTPWPGDPRVNLQKAKGGKAKPYQVGQATAALEALAETLEDEDEEGEDG